LLREAAGKPFTLEIGGLNSFFSAPFLEVADPEGGLDRIRALLLRAGKDIGGSDYPSDYNSPYNRRNRRAVFGDLSRQRGNWENVGVRLWYVACPAKGTAF